MNPDEIKAFVNGLEGSAISFILSSKYVFDSSEVNALTLEAKRSVLTYQMLYDLPCSRPEPDNICDPFFTFKDEVTK